MSKYKKQIQTMVNENHELFIEFKVLHDKLAAGDESLRDEFNDKGQKLLRIIRRYENTLCARSENSGYAKFAGNLSDKFWDEIRVYLPFIDQVPLL